MALYDWRFDRDRDGKLDYKEERELFDFINRQGVWAEEKQESSRDHYYDDLDDDLVEDEFDADLYDDDFERDSDDDDLFGDDFDDDF